MIVWAQTYIAPPPILTADARPIFSQLRPNSFVSPFAAVAMVFFYLPGMINSVAAASKGRKGIPFLFCVRKRGGRSSVALWLKPFFHPHYLRTLRSKRRDSPYFKTLEKVQEANMYRLLKARILTYVDFKDLSNPAFSKGPS